MTFSQRLAQLAKWPLRRLLAVPALRQRLIFELRQNHYSDLQCHVPIGHGLTCPVQFWEAWASLGHIFFEDEYARAFEHLPPPARWVDIGCYAGYFSLYVALLRARRGLAGRGEAMLIDADSRAHGAVAEMLRLNQLDWTFRRGAIAREPGVRRFIERAFMTSSLAGDGADTEPATEVKVITAQDILSSFPPPYDLVKIDIEGGEYDFLLAYQAVLSQTNALLLEWHGWHPGGGGEAQLRSMVESHGLRLACEVLAPTEAQHRDVATKSGVHLYTRVR